MCQDCFSTPCSCDVQYSFNWYSTTGLPCTNCSGDTICKKKVPALCTIYNGAALSGLGLPSPSNIEAIIALIDVAISNLKLSNLQLQADNTALAARVKALEDAV